MTVPRWSFSAPLRRAPRHDHRHAVALAAERLDAEHAAWYADVPNKRCVRVREGGEVLQTVALDRGGFSCALGGVNRRTLYVVATEWRGMEKVEEVARARTGQVLSIEAPAPGV